MLDIKEMTKSNFLNLLATGHSDSHNSDKTAATKTLKHDEKKASKSSNHWDALRDDYMLTSRPSLKVYFLYFALLLCYRVILLMLSYSLYLSLYSLELGYSFRFVFI
jgi:hypothetical protein